MFNFNFTHHDNHINKYNLTQYHCGTTIITKISKLNTTYKQLEEHSGWSAAPLALYFFKGESCPCLPDLPDLRLPLFTLSPLFCLA